MAERNRATHLGSKSPNGISRRWFVHSVTGMGAGMLGAPWVVAQSPNSVPSAPSSTKRSGLLMQPADIPALDTRAKIALELSGKVHVAEPGEQTSESKTTVEVKAKSTLDYLEKIAFAPMADSKVCHPVAAGRRYYQAEVENWIAGKTSRRELRSECAETRLMPYQGLWQQYSEKVPLDTREIQLLQSPFNSAVAELLLPLEPAKPESTWTVRPEDAQLLFHLDAVHKSTLVAKISKVEKGVATVELQGTLQATANSVPTQLDIHGNFQAKLASRCAMVTWLGLVIQEKRQVSRAEPGFDITARIRVIREESEQRLEITDAALRELARGTDDGRWLIRLQSVAGHYSMLADRRWHIHRDSAEEAILRMVENNTIIAQCAVSRLSALEAGQQLTIEGLQADIRKSLGNTFREFLESSEKLNANQLRMLRTVVAGEVDEVPIQWIYTHLSDDSGRRLALVYTMGGNVTDRFGAADEQMAISFEWLPDSHPSEGEKSPKSPAAPPKLTAEAPRAKQNQ
jgi:hypothetical protein